ncbi:hypothetical protein Bca52824_001536 [Brassica carinata]|uniref:Uncharacterized protein n=1 Tax=Brassica carinata TaxID=52824 RepID=A0A8X7WIX7_BRACI|nr:hypothetical protein Bca52824_001536 [Brassica carinata]
MIYRDCKWLHDELKEESLLLAKKIGSKLPKVQMFVTVRIIGAVPVSNMNFHKLLHSKTHVVLYPGYDCEALHRKIVNSLSFLHVWL